MSLLLLFGHGDIPLPPEVEITFENALGCGKVGIAIVERSDTGAVVRDVSQDFVEAEFDRRLNDISEAKVVLRDCLDWPRGEDFDTGFPVPLVQPWRHVLMLAWDEAIVWFGPIVHITQQPDGKGVIEARDIMEWMRHRKIRDPFDSTGAPVDVRAIFEDLVANGFDQDASVSYAITASDTGITAERKYTAGESGYVYDAATELVTTGLDFTVVGSQIICGDVDIPTPAIGVINNQHLASPPGLHLDGQDQANFETLFGRDEGDAGDQLIGLAQDGPSQIDYGLLDSIDNEDEIRDQISLDAAADTRLSLRVDPLILIDELQLATTAPLKVTDLIPGAIISSWLEGTYVFYFGDIRLRDAKFVAETLASERGDPRATCWDCGMSDRNVATLDPLARKFDDLGRRVRKLQNRKRGVGFESYAIGDILYADTASTLAKLPDVATGNALISGGVGVAPAWGKIGLASHVSGSLPVDSIASEAWSSWTPAIRQNGATFAQIVTLANYEKLSRVVIVEGYIECDDTSFVSNAEIDVTHSGLPAPATSGEHVVGAGLYVDLSVGYARLIVTMTSSRFRFYTTETGTNSSNLGQDPGGGFAAATGDLLLWHAIYRSSS